MKKGRPGALLTVLCEPEAARDLLDIVFRETTTIGARIAYERREELDRWTGSVGTPFGKLRVKYARLGDGSIKAAPEYEACKAAAKKHGVSIADVYEAARGKRIARKP
jgi:uncharacterized protein (DUF111 family)